MDTPQATARIAGHPLHPLLVTIPIGSWVLAFLSDLAYWLNGWAMWAYASTWLIGIAIVSALIAALAGFADFFGDRRIREIRRAWWHMLGNLTAVVVAAVNFIVHMRDGAAAVIPTGLILSTVTVLILLFTGWQGGELVFRHGVAVHPRPEAP